MKIELKETELVTAVREYIVKEGINVDGKSVDIDFTATRVGDRGVVATIVIESIPAVPKLEEPASAPALAVVSSVKRAPPAPAPAKVDTPVAVPVAAGPVSVKLDAPRDLAAEIQGDGKTEPDTTGGADVSGKTDGAVKKTGLFTN